MHSKWVKNCQDLMDLLHEQYMILCMTAYRYPLPSETDTWICRRSYTLPTIYIIYYCEPVPLHSNGRVQPQTRRAVQKRKGRKDILEIIGAFKLSANHTILQSYSCRNRKSFFSRISSNQIPSQKHPANDRVPLGRAAAGVPLKACLLRLPQNHA